MTFTELYEAYEQLPTPNASALGSVYMLSHETCHAMYLTETEAALLCARLLAALRSFPAESQRVLTVG